MAAQAILGLVLKLIQLNIWQGKILIAVSRFLKQQDADILCLQEVCSSSVYLGALDLLSSLEVLQLDLAYPYVYYQSSFSFDTSGVTASMGNTILSKYPLENTRSVFTHNSYHEVTDWQRDHPGNTRNLQLAEVTLPDGKSFTVANHHGYWDKDKMGNEHTVAAMKIAAEELKKVQGPLIFAGDLNIVPASPAMHLFDNWLTDLTATHNISDTLSAFGKVSDVPCDHILVSPEVTVQEFTVSEELVSDHKALILVFEV